ncbi:hypothetical protein Spico_1023 [Parasphaerochaeta coccoides DSM 17374]|uniref:Uncharacterized protein n=1 Tax=Parasphaerochaeta coccoides (strain ATCC BAA-1237 / DSM 17374 / SPN1) TaxID=760011 RepID=F4GJI0_PARC1|nr:hypothetical protein Spico_1023 [Parasphaerochaeta coccoides DSM 17374]
MNGRSPFLVSHCFHFFVYCTFETVFSNSINIFKRKIVKKYYMFSSKNHIFG